MSTGPTVTILIPVYNTAKYLPRSLGSTFRQTWKNLEVIVIDDASPDNLKQIIQQPECQDPRVRVLHLPENRGTASARRAGVEAARGEYILCVDADDTLDNTAIEYLVKTAMRTKADIVGYASRSVNTDGSPMPYGDLFDASPFVLEGQRVFDALFRAHAYSWSVCLKLIRSELFRKAISLLPDQYCILAEDFMYCSAIAFFAQKIVSTGQILYNYYSEIGITKDAKITLAAFKRAASMLNALKAVRDFLKSQNVWDLYAHAFSLRERENLLLLYERWTRMQPEDQLGANEYLYKNYDADRIKTLFAEFSAMPDHAGNQSRKRFIPTESFLWKSLKWLQAKIKFRKSRVFYDC